MAEREYENVQTGIPEVELRMIKGAKIEVPEDIIRLFYESAKAYAKTKDAMRAQAVEQKMRHEQLVKYVKAITGLRGVRSEPDDFNLLVIDKEALSWDQALLKASLGPVYSALVSEELVTTITIPPGVTTEEELRSGLLELLAKLKVEPADIPKLLEIEVQLRIDTEKIDDLVAAERVQLLPGTREVEISWTIDSGPLKTPQKRKVGKKEKAA
jgi:hypothetical protein